MTTARYDLDDKYWRGLKEKSALAGITLDEAISPRDFMAYGDRIAARQLEMFERVGGPPIERSAILDIGAGVGRLLKPFSKRFRRAVGVDMNDRILEAARAFIGDESNIELIRNDGRSLPLPDNSFEYVFCGGVLQHIPDIEIILGYFREGLRVLKPGGVLNYSIMVWMTSREGGVQGDHVGAKVTSADIDSILNETGHVLRAVFSDPRDPYPHFSILIEKAPPVSALLRRVARRFRPFTLKHEHVTAMNVRTGIFEDLPSYANMRALWASGERRPITFF